MTDLSEAFKRRIESFYERTEEFYDKNQLRDKEGRWTRGGSSGMSPTESPWSRGPTAGKIWSGVSAHPTLRTRPKATVEISKMNLSEAKAFAKSLYDADLGDGYTSHVTEVQESGTISVVGVIMKRGREVGSFERSIGSDEPAPLQRVFDRSLVAPPPRQLPAIVVSHDQLYMNPSHQSKGVGDRFNAHAVAEYQKVGVDRIVLHAGDTVGGFAWARQGFRYDEGGDFHGDKRRREFLNKQLDRMATHVNAPVVRPHTRALNRDIKALRAAIAAGEDVQPIHIASVGEKYIRYESRDDHANNYTNWPGKKVLLGTSWPAVYYFDGSQTISASASSLEHATLRPAFRTAVEEFYNKNHSREDGKFVSGALAKSGKGVSVSVRSQDVKCTPQPCVNESIDRVGTIARALIHRSIIKRMLDGGTPPPTLTILGGGGGSGKTTVSDAMGLKRKGEVTINADDVKEMIPEYPKLVARADHTAAAFVHEESSKIAKDAQSESRRLGIGITLDQVGSDPKKVASQVSAYAEAGYKDIRAVYIAVDTDVAVSRAVDRGKRTGRIVPETVLRAAHRDVSRNFESIASNPQIGDVRLYDNNSSSPTLIASGGGGKPLVIHDQMLYNSFLAKGEV